MKSSIFLLIFAVLQSVNCEHSGILEDFRLPKSIKPEHYKLNITTHIGDSHGTNFKGDVWIFVKALEQTDKISLHSKGLKLNLKLIKVFTLNSEDKNKNFDSNASISGDQELKVSRTKLVEKFDFLEIFLENRLKEQQKYAIFIPFERRLDGNNLGGYYLSSYHDRKSGQTKYLAVTHFEPAYAREAFPCFDEPDMKATFDITLVHSKKFTAISNMPLESTKPSTSIEDFVEDTFKRTKAPMSTYTIAYCVSEFQFKGNRKFRVFARPDVINQTEYAVEIGPKILKYFENYFRIKYLLPKVDMIGIPDFRFGAMENWGLITYRESQFLNVGKDSYSSYASHAGSTISHEIAHQWFGNLVTFKWWISPWLNEGFANYFETFGLSHVHPDWNIENIDHLENSLKIFDLDSMESTSPLTVATVESSNLYRLEFSYIHYEKGSLTIAMMQKILGEENFKNALRKYLNSFKNSNVEVEDLLNALTPEDKRSLPSNASFKDVMKTWIYQTNYPIIYVKRDYKTNSAKLTQSRFLSTSPESRRNRAEDNFCWWIPLTYTDSRLPNFNETSPKNWMGCDADKKPVEKIIENLPDKQSWLIFNLQISGLYRIKYDTKNYKLIIKTLNSEDFKLIHPMNRAQLIDDAMALAWVGEQNYDLTLSLINYLKREDDLLPWMAATENIDKIQNLLSKSSDYQELFKSYVQGILAPIYEKIGGIDARPKEFQKQKLQYEIVSKACPFEVGNCETKVVEIVNDWMESSDPDKFQTENIPTNLRYIVYCTGIKKGKEKVWNFFKDRLMKSDSTEEIRHIKIALGCSRQRQMLAQYLKESLNSTVIQAFKSVAQNNVGYEVARSFFFENIDDINAELSKSGTKITKILNVLTRHMSSEGDIEQLKKLASKPFITKSVLEKSMEAVKRNEFWITKSSAGFKRRIGEILRRNQLNEDSNNQQENINSEENDEQKSVIT